MSNESNAADSLDFLKSMWNSMGFSLPGMITPTLDVDELGKRIADLKAVEGWLKMNLNTLQMSIQGLEMQRVALATMQAMGQAAQPAADFAHAAPAGAAQAAAQAIPGFDPSAANPFVSSALNPALWPWNFMQPPSAPETEPAPAQPKRTTTRSSTSSTRSSSTRKKPAK